MAEYTLDDIAASFHQKKNWEKQFPLNCHVVRPVSFYITYLIMKLTDSPGKIAWAGFFTGLAGCFSFVGIHLWSPWPGIVLLSAFSLLDAVDGNVARTTGNVTHYGMLLDSVLGEIIESGYCLCIGIGLGIRVMIQTPEHSALLPVICGAVIMGGRLAGSFIDVKYESVLLKKRGHAEDIHGEIGVSTYRRNLFYLVFINCNLLNNQIVFLAICVWFDVMPLFLIVLACYYCVRVITFFVFFMHRAKNTLSKLSGKENS